MNQETKQATVKITKRTYYTNVEKLKIIERVKNGKTKANLFCK
jgi:hypothetical protein